MWLKSRSLTYVALVAFVAGIMFMSGCLTVKELIGPDKGPKTSLNIPGTLANAQDTALPGVGPDQVAKIVDKTGPAVVKIETIRTSQEGITDPFLNDPFFRQFFGDYPRRPREERGLGSGFIYSSEGYIITNEHVINGANSIEVIIQGFKGPLPATIVGADFDLDLAVIKVQVGKPLPTLKMGDSNKVKVGNWVIAIGNPFGLDHTVTVGVISAKERPVSVENRSYKNLLQTDASINPGNSGGPLLNLNGEVVGINTAVAQAQGIGFAIPINTAKSILPDLIKKGKIIRPWLGVQLQDLSKELAGYLGLNNDQGALIVGVVAGSPAARAGLRQGDVIVKINNLKINNPDNLIEAIKETKIGQKVALLIYRQGEKKTVSLTISEKPAY
ncbi:MAG: trypsin-like peptidase domain-containing protein [Peptococcaceae bacterium]